jgi:hypothetical protein
MRIMRRTQADEYDVQMWMVTMQDREKRITEYRRNKPIAELERKWNKAKGRHSNHYWCAEWLDLAHARSREMARFFMRFEKSQQEIDPRITQIVNDNFWELT